MMPRRRSRGFTMPELLFALGILGIFALAGTQLFYSTVRISRATAQQQDAAASFDSALTVLRGDAWVATEIAAPDPTTARLGKITWTIKDSTLTRETGDSSRPHTWPVPKGLTFAGDGASIVVRIPAASAGERGGDVRMVSEPLLLARLTS